MELFNFDSIVQQELGEKTTYKENQWFLPANCFRGIVVGQSGSGKTSLLLNLLLDGHLNYDKIIVCAKQLDEEKYAFLQKFFTDIATKNRVKVNDIYQAYSSLDALPDVDTEKDTKSTKMIIFDDLVNEKDQQKICDYYIRGRKKGFTCFYLAHRYTNVPKMLRANSSLFIIYSQRPKEQQIICQDVCGDLDKEEFYKMFNQATKESHSFLLIDLNNPLKYRKGLTEFFIEDQD